MKQTLLKYISFCILILPFSLYAEVTADTHEKKESIAIIYKKGLASIDNKDVRLAVDLLLKEVTAKSKYTIKTEFSNDLKKTIDDFQHSKIDILSLGFIYYLQHYDEINDFIEDRWVLLAKKNDKFRRFLLITNKKSNINSLKDLRDKSVGLVKFDSIQDLYLDTTLLQEQKEDAASFLKTKKYYLKPSRALIKLFFNQIDACIVTEYAYNTATEINPQLKKQLKIIQRSEDIFPPIVLILTHKNSSYFSKLYEKFVFTSQMNPKTKQILNMYQTVQSVGLSDEDIQPIYRYYQTYKQLKNEYKQR